MTNATTEKELADEATWKRILDKNRDWKSAPKPKPAPDDLTKWQTTDQKYAFNKANMTGRHVVYDGETWIVRSVYTHCTGVSYLLSKDDGKFECATINECCSCYFG